MHGEPARPGRGQAADGREALARYLDELEEAEQVTASVERLARFAPAIIEAIEAAAGHGLRSRRMTSGAGHDAQMMARICPAAMIFVSSIGGISHSPREQTLATDLAARADILLDVVQQLACRPPHSRP
jgi:N-carbamoyl-L-amino-acid hydrolase